MANNLYGLMSEDNFNPFMAAGLGGVGGGLASMLNPGQSPFDAAKPYMDKANSDVGDYYKQALGFLSPYMQMGQQGAGNFNNILGQYANPTGLYDHIMSGFKMSPAQQYAQTQGLNAISNNAAMRGMMGSGSEAKALESYAQNNTSQNQQQYLDDILGIFGKALGGYQDQYHMGQNAATNAGQFGMDTGRSQAMIQQALAEAAAAQQQQKDNDSSGFFGDLGSLVGGFL